MTPTATPEAGAAAAAPATRRASKPEPARANRDAIIQSHGGLHGGDVSLDYVAAGPFTYDHATGLGTYPTFGYNDRTIDPNDGVVESLESGDFACGDHVTFFTQIAIDDGADGPERSSSTRRGAWSRPVSPVSASTTSCPSRSTRPTTATWATWRTTS